MAAHGTPAEKKKQGELGALTKWSMYDPVEGTAKARAASPGALAYWLPRVDPDGELPEAERLRRAECARKAHFAGLALKSLQARRHRAESAAAGTSP